MIYFRRVGQVVKKKYGESMMEEKIATAYP